MYFNPGLPYLIDVYNGAGKLLKRIHGSHEPILVTDTIINKYTVLGVERNSDGVEFIVRYRYSTLEEI